MAHFNQKYTFQNVKEKALLYSTKKDFELNARPYYAAAHRNGWLEQICSHMMQERKVWTKEKVLELLMNYSNISSFLTENSGAYKHAIKNNYIKDIKLYFESKEKSPKAKKWDKQKIIDFVRTCNSYSEFYRTEAYFAACKMDLLEEINIILPKQKKQAHNKKWTFDKCLDAISECNSRAQFMYEFAGAYRFLQAEGRLQEAFDLAKMGYMSGTSLIEKEICDWLRKENIRFEHKSKILGRLEIDIYIPDKRIGIEVNGLYWHSEEHKDKYYHLNKTELAKRDGISLIHVFEDAYQKRFSGVKNYILSKVKTNQKIYARKCSVELLDKSISKIFFNENHMQGASGKSILNVGLKYNEDIVAVMSFGPHHRNTKNKSIALTRLAYKYGVSVIGGASKMLKFVEKQLFDMGYNKIISWSDNSISNGGVYEKLGFELEEILDPDYSYTKSGEKFSKQSLKKTPEERLTGKTEHELRSEQGYKRIWDCGKKRWSKLIPKYP